MIGLFLFIMSLQLRPNLDAWTCFFYNDWIFVIMSSVPTWTLAVKPLISLFHPLVPLLESRGRGRGGV